MRFPVTFRYQDRTTTVEPMDADQWRLQDGLAGEPIASHEIAKRICEGLGIAAPPPYGSEIQLSGSDLRGFLKNNTSPRDTWWFNWDGSSQGARGGCAGAERSLEAAIELLLDSLLEGLDEPEEQKNQGF